MEMKTAPKDSGRPLPQGLILIPLEVLLWGSLYAGIVFSLVIAMAAFVVAFGHLLFAPHLPFFAWVGHGTIFVLPLFGLHAVQTRLTLAHIKFTLLREEVIDRVKGGME
jgi:hypothetical protein